MEQAGHGTLTRINSLLQSFERRNMLPASIGRLILAVLAGYVTNALLVGATEQLLSRLRPNPDYFVADLITQCLYEVAAGYLCCFIAKRSERWIALVGLVGLGLLVGTISLIASWKVEPHWYGIALLSVWAPCLWIGYALEHWVTDRNSAP
jgi:peptidoglycan/LPS O-acetylase OafA/YrhL